ncbi:hypothetical protein TSST111916_09185 [Tsukamurella strandjordii]|uniref:hypothetical protein n=1 Tax=Tsukamurella TaxID=2060 RepID=UPI001C7DBA41|nr:hypothetical protein [Tsukamurella sp. TY48]GIZ97500.1 hypothetical protein TTY48_21120 [Tsukamurella sp. TY48]
MSNLTDLLDEVQDTSTNAELDTLADQALAGSPDVDRDEIVEQFRVRRAELRGGDSDTEFYIDLGHRPLADEFLGNDPALRAWLSNLEAAAQGNGPGAQAARDRLAQFEADWDTALTAAAQAAGARYGVTVFTGEAHDVLREADIPPGSSWYQQLDNEGIYSVVEEITINPVLDSVRGWTWKVA